MSSFQISLCRTQVLMDFKALQVTPTQTQQEPLPLRTLKTQAIKSTWGLALQLNLNQYLVHLWHPLDSSSWPAHQ